MAPTGLRQRFLKLIDRERRRAAACQDGEIIAKVNSLIDDEIIEALYAASRAGVRVRLNVRGICALRPGVPGVSDRIEVVSLIDRFLEHSRSLLLLQRRRRGRLPRQRRLDDPQPGQAGRAEFPIEQPEPKVKVLDALRAMFRDTEKSRWLQADGSYCRRTARADEPRFRVQEALHEQARRTAAMARERTGVTFRPKSPRPLEGA
jgi:polyphosphate kinase